jgi:lathosterol oxidase
MLVVLFCAGYLGLAASAMSFILFTDCLIYWIHRGLHHRLVYSAIHKPHHAWKVTTPFASHAFHPIDGFLQSTPYHIYVFLFPMHKVLYLALYVAVNIWTVSIHDGDFRVPALLKPIINGAAHHTDHHLLYTYNYGQYFTLWDRIGGSFRNPTAFEGNGPLDYVEKMEASKGKTDSRKAK